MNIASIETSEKTYTNTHTHAYMHCILQNAKHEAKDIRTCKWIHLGPSSKGSEASPHGVQQEADRSKCVKRMHT